MIVRRLYPADAAAYRERMLQGYAQHPDAFTSSVHERAAAPMSWWLERVAEGEDTGEAVFGAFLGNTLAGAVGYRRETREKTQHKAALFGMYVVPEARQAGAGERLVHALLAHARQRPGLRLIQLTVSEGNDRAIRLYERCGFITFGIEPMAIREGGRFIAKIHMWHDLQRDAA
jgi:RimJ/RimL family protein N-acetyltransferase